MNSQKLLILFVGGYRGKPVGNGRGKLMILAIDGSHREKWLGCKDTVKWDKTFSVNV